jgi:hypothetical protein
MERWLGVADKPGMGTAWRLEVHWPWPTWATLLAAAALVAIVVYVYLREGRRVGRGYRLILSVLRLCQIALVLAMAAQIELLLQRTGLPFVVVIVDDTKSMTTVDQYDDAQRKSLEDRLTKTLSAPVKLSRWNIERTLFTENGGELLRDLGEDHKLRFYFLSDFRKSRRDDAPGIVEELKAAVANGDSTRLGTMVRSALDELRGTTPAAIVLASDGINTEGPGLLDAASYARHKGVPMFLIGIGSDHTARSVTLSDLEVEDTVFVNDLVHFRFKLTASGFQGKSVGIVLRRKASADGGAEAKNEIVAHSDVTVAADGRPQQVVIPYRPTQPGQFPFTIEIEPAGNAGFSRDTEKVPLGDGDSSAPPKSGIISAPAENVATGPPLSRSLDVRDEKIRVLMVDGSPRYEWRYLYWMLRRDPTIELRTLLQEADGEFGNDKESVFVKSFPDLLKEPQRQDNEPRQYDVVIFGDANPSLLGPAALQNLADFIDRGGAVVFIAGPNFLPKAYANTPLARLLPFDSAAIREPTPTRPLKEGFVAKPTESGLANAAMQLEDSAEDSHARWKKLPPLYWMVEVSDLKPAARVLAENPTRTGPDGKRLPLIILQYVGGGGRVLFHATDETYHWRREMGDLYFARYWVQMLRYLARPKLAEHSKSVKLTTDRQDYRLGDPVRMKAYFPDDRTAPLDDNGVTIALEQTGRETKRVQLRRDAQANSGSARGRFEAVLSDLPAGPYHVKMTTPTFPSSVPAADFVVAPPETELARIQMDTTAMQHAAALTNGKYYSFQDAGRLPTDLPGGRQVPVENLPSVPLWNRWPVLLLFLVLLIAEWLLRKRYGMV